MLARQHWKTYLCPIHTLEFSIPDLSGTTKKLLPWEQIERQLQSWVPIRAKKCSTSWSEGIWLIFTNNSIRKATSEAARQRGGRSRSSQFVHAWCFCYHYIVVVVSLKHIFLLGETKSIFGWGIFLGNLINTIVFAWSLAAASRWATKTNTRPQAGCYNHYWVATPSEHAFMKTWKRNVFDIFSRKSRAQLRSCRMSHVSFCLAMASLFCAWLEGLSCGKNHTTTTSTHNVDSSIYFTYTLSLSCWRRQTKTSTNKTKTKRPVLTYIIGWLTSSMQDSQFSSKMRAWNCSWPFAI